MNFRYAGTADGREIYVTGAPDARHAAPAGYSIAAVVLPDDWSSDELGSLLNQLYGGLEDWTEFNPDRGARSFVFYGPRSEEASNLCDAFAFAWSHGAETQYNDIIAASNDAPDVAAFVEAVLSGEIAASDTYAEKLSSVLFAVLASGSNEDAQTDPLAERVADAVTAAVAQRRFD